MAENPGTIPDAFTTSARGDYLVVHGEIDASVADAVLASILDEHDSTARCVDLSGVTFLDSAGVRTLLRARVVLAQQNRRLVIVNPSDAVVSLFDLLGLSEIWGH